MWTYIGMRSHLLVMLFGAVLIVGFGGVQSRSHKGHSGRGSREHISGPEKHRLNHLTNQTGDPDDVIYTPWSEWSQCYARCLQKRTRRCLQNSKCKDNIQRESRDCTFGSCRDKYAPKKIRHGLSRRLQDMVFNLLYNEWSSWSMCTRSCKQRRFRTCAMSNWCKNVLLMEEGKCYHEGTNCEQVWLAENVVDHEELDEVDHELGDSGKKKKKPKLPEVEVVPALPPDPVTCGKRPAAPSLRIVGGYESRRGSWPWQVAVTTKKGEQFCGGVLVAPQWVITAAHCIRKNGRKRRVMVRVGEYDLMGTDGTETDMKTITDFPHPDFNMETIDGDIALIKLSEPVPGQDDIGFACIPSPEDDLAPQTICYAVGWGKVKETHRFGTDVLREAPVPLVDSRKCQNAFDYEITRSQMCAGYRRGGIDTCAGDSGGPLMCEIVRGGVSQWYAYGITSFGEGCGEKGKFGIYTKVALFSNWIKNITHTGL